MDQIIGRPADAEADVRAALKRQRAAFDTSPRPTAVQRQERLQRLEQLVRQNQERIVDAIGADFGNRSRVETIMSEVLPAISRLPHMRAAIWRAGCARNGARSG